MVQIIEENRKPTTTERFNQAFGNIVNTGSQLAMAREQGKKQKEIDKRLSEKLGFDISGLDPEIKKLVVAETLKGQTKAQESAAELAGNRQSIRGIESQRNLPEGSLSAFENNPSLAEQTTRPGKEPKKTQASQPIDPEQLSIIKNIRNTDAYKSADPLTKYQILTDSGVSKENAQAEADIASKQADIHQKSFESSYKAQEDFINDTTASYKGFESEMKPRLLQIQSLPPEDIIGPTSAVFLEHLGIPLGALENPASELFNKLSQDLLKGLPETYGNRILKVEVDNFLKTIPTLMNSPDGRRMVASNMLKLGEMKEVYYKEMRKEQKNYLDENKPLPRDFQQRIFDQVKPQIDRINNEFIKLAEVTSVPEGTVPFFSPQGEIKFVPVQQMEWAEKNGGRRIW
jgi:hypothetical protein